MNYFEAYDCSLPPILNPIRPRKISNVIKLGDRALHKPSINNSTVTIIRT